jgi:sugar phosphate isomerase/epimerase
MKVLMSVNYKFMNVTPKNLLDLIHQNNSKLDGFEVCINANSANEINYLKELAFEAHRNNLVLQMHGTIYNDELTNYKYIDTINDISNIMETNINIVYHPIYNESKEESVATSTRFLNNMLNYIRLKNYRITLSVENLNDIINQDRLNKDDLIPILEKLPNLRFTYDIGHELIDYGNITDLNEILKQRLNNVHIHTFHNTHDHQIMTNDDIHKESWIKGITYLKVINYSGTMVLEYDLNSFWFDTIEEKIVGYLNSIDKITEYFYD